jgi:pilus assembly protein Flp/PilA
MLHNFLQDQRGATAIEYGLIVSMIFLAIVAAISNFAGHTGGMFNKIANSMNGD